MGYTARVRAEDADLLNYRWHAKLQPRAGDGGIRVYAFCRALNDYLHRVVMRRMMGGTLTPGLIVMHIHDSEMWRGGLDCHRGELQEGTYADNCRRLRKCADATSKFWGVRFDAAPKSWRKPWIISGFGTTLGHFATELLAARAYDRLTLARDPYWPRLNFATPKKKP